MAGTTSQDPIRRLGSEIANRSAPRVQTPVGVVIAAATTVFVTGGALADDPSTRNLGPTSAP
jgi:hypothetical protein